MNTLIELLPHSAGGWITFELWFFSLIVSDLLIIRKNMSQTCVLLPLLFNVVGLFIVIVLCFYYSKISKK